MSTDYYLECSVCEDDILCFTNVDRDPQFFNVLKFIMEHNLEHQSKERFKILHESERIDKVCDIECGYRKKPIQFKCDADCLEDIIEISVKYSDGSGYTYNPNKEREEL